MVAFIVVIAIAVIVIVGKIKRRFQVKRKHVQYTYYAHDKEPRQTEVRGLLVSENGHLAVVPRIEAQWETQEPEKVKGVYEIMHVNTMLTFPFIFSRQKDAVFALPYLEVGGKWEDIKDKDLSKAICMEYISAMQRSINDIRYMKTHGKISEVFNEYKVELYKWTNQKYVDQMALEFSL